MNKIFTTLFAAVLSLTALAQKPCKIEGKVADDYKFEKLYVYLSNADYAFDGELVDSLVVKNGKFSYSTQFAEVRRALFVPVLDGGKSVSMKQTQLILVPGEKAVLNMSQKAVTISGSKFYQQWGAADENIGTADRNLREFVDRVNKEAEGKTQEELAAMRDNVMKEYSELMEKRNTARSQYGEQHIGELGCAAYYATMLGDAVKIYDNSTDEVRNTEVGKLVKRLADDERARKEAQAKAEAEAKAAEGASAEGKMFVDFEAEYNGKVQKLSDYVGKGKYVLVDFWASWCGPCKAEIPNLIEVYNKYKGDKFMVLGVATWDKPKDTEKAIEQMKIPYPQIMNAQKAGSDAYGILGIPQIILFGPDGTILKRDLRGEVIEATIKSYLEK